MPPVLVVEDLVKTYPATRKTPAVEAVRGISFAVEAGETFGLLGPNGAGKSTTLGCITTPGAADLGPRRRWTASTWWRAPQDAKRLHRGGAPDPQPRPRPHRARGADVYHGRYFGLAAAEREARADRLLAEMQLTDKADAKPLTLSGGHAAAGDDRARAHARPARAAPRRAHHRPRPPGPPHAVGHAARPAAAAASPSSSPRTTWRRPTGSASGWPSSTTAASSPSTRPAALKRALPGGQILDVWVRGAAPAGAAAARRCPACCASRRLERDGGRRRAASACGSSSIPATACSTACCARCARAAATSHHVSLTAPSLEDVYIHLTGQGAARMTAFLALLRRDLLVAVAQRAHAAHRDPHPAHPGGARVREHPAPAAAWWRTSSAR